MSKAAELAKMGEVLTNNQIGGRRNIIINGAMMVYKEAQVLNSLVQMDLFVIDFNVLIKQMEQ